MFYDQVEESIERFFASQWIVQIMGPHHPWPPVIENWFMCQKKESSSRFESTTSKPITLPTLLRTGWPAVHHSTKSTTDWVTHGPSLYQLYHGLSDTWSITLPTLPRTGWPAVHHSTNSTTDWVTRGPSLYQLYYGLETDYQEIVFINNMWIS